MQDAQNLFLRKAMPVVRCAGSRLEAFIIVKHIFAIWILGSTYSLRRIWCKALNVTWEYRTSDHSSPCRF